MLNWIPFTPCLFGRFASRFSQMRKSPEYGTISLMEFELCIEQKVIFVCWSCYYYSFSSGSTQFALDYRMDLFVEISQMANYMYFAISFPPLPLITNIVSQSVSQSSNKQTNKQILCKINYNWLLILFDWFTANCLLSAIQCKFFSLSQQILHTS